MVMLQMFAKISQIWGDREFLMAADRGRVLLDLGNLEFRFKPELTDSLFLVRPK